MVLLNCKNSENSTFKGDCMEIGIVKYFQSIANGFFDAFFWLITKMGEETFFLFLLAIIYICYSKIFAIKFSLFYLISVGINNVIKLIIRRPRPYVVSTEISDKLHASGYSFPSGHTQGYFINATTIAIEIGKRNKSNIFKNILYSTLFVMGLLVMISRMYLGQHFLTDVIAGMLLGIGLPFLLNFLLKILSVKIKKLFTIDRFYLILGILAIVLAIVLIFVNIFTGISINKAYKFSAIFIAMMIGYFVDKKYINYISNQGFIIGVIKAIISIVTIVLLYILLSLIMKVESYWCFVVYLFLGLICTIILPMCFKLIFKKGYNNEECNNK